jgi:uncharacterized membrane protein YkgB
VTRFGQLISRYGLVFVLAWIGFGKYPKMESRVLIEHRPLMSWIYHFLSVGAVAAALGTTRATASARLTANVREMPTNCGVSACRPARSP